MKSFTLETRQAPSNTSVTVIDMQGELDTNNAADFEKTLDNIFSEGKYKIVLNMEKLIYISSAGFGILMSNIKDVRKHRGDIKITNVRPDVYSIFELLELPGLFHILKTEREAIQEFA